MAKRCVCVTDLDTPVVFEKQTGQPDGMGGVGDEWSLVYDAWASVVPARGRERFTGGKLQGENPHVITVQFAPGITIDNSLRVRFMDGNNKELLLNIRAAIDLDNKHEWVEVYAEEGVGT